MKLFELLNEGKLNKHLIDRNVNKQKHPTLDLYILNYAPQAAFGNFWGDGTIDYCRGLIFNGVGDVVARPFKKFFNLGTPSMPETMVENLPPYLPEITKKMDGSLGIWYDDGTPEGAIATRGSFTSPQALWATDWWKNQPNPVDTKLFKEWTPLFEIIYSENRIVVDYGKFSGLVCIGGVYKHSGRDVPRELLEAVFGNAVILSDGATWPKFDYDGVVFTPRVFTHSPLSDLEKSNEPNAEGYVASYDEGRLRVKIKFEDYKRLHRIITGVNPHSLWELLIAGKDIDRHGLPENFVRWADKWTDYLVGEHNRILSEATEVYVNRPIREAGEPERVYRASFARWAATETKDRPYLKPLLFRMLDGFDPSPIIWAQIEPAGNDNRFSTSGIDATEGE
jgi:RNA ligase